MTKYHWFVIFDAYIAKFQKIWFKTSANTLTFNILAAGVILDAVVSDNTAMISTKTHRIPIAPLDGVKFVKVVT